MEIKVLTAQEREEFFMSVKKVRGYGKVSRMIDKFLESGDDIAKVTVGKSEYKDIRSAYKSINATIGRLYKGRLRVVMRGNNVYLVNMIYTDGNGSMLTMTNGASQKRQE